MTDLTMTTPLDPGITRTVAALQAHGFRTTDSGDGVSKGELIGNGCAEPYPHVFMAMKPIEMLNETDRLLAVARELFTPEAVADMYANPFDDAGDIVARRSIEATYSPVNGVAMLCLIGFSDADLRAA